MQKKPPPDPEFEVSHVFSHDIVRQNRRNTRVYLFSQTFSPHLTANFILPTEFVFFQVNDSYRAEAHTHRDNAEFILPLEGKYCCSINGRKLTIRPSEGVLIQHGDTHLDDCREPCAFLGIGFKPLDFLGRPWDGEVIKKPNSAAERCFSYAGDAELETLVALARKQIESTQPFIKQSSYVFAQMLVWRFLNPFYERISPRFLALLSNNLFQLRINRLFLDNLHRDLPVAEMAKEMKMSRKALEMNCSQLLGSSPAKAFLGLKLERAAKLLRAGKSSKDVTEELGFNNQFHFSRVFKTHYGISATEYRAKR